MSERTIVILALCMFAISWFVPVHDSLRGTPGGWYDPSPRIGGDGWFAEGTPPGWRAVVTAWDLLVHEWKTWRSPVCGVTCFTNLAMLLALVSVLRGSPSRVLGWVLVFCAVLNASWVYLLLDDMSFVRDLRVGYYLWTASFAIAAFGTLLWSRRPQ